MSDKYGPYLFTPIDVDDAAMAERVVHLLSKVEGIRVADGFEPPDLAIVRPPTLEIASQPDAARKGCAPPARRRRLQQGDRPAARDLGSHRQIPRRVDLGKARCHGGHHSRP